MDWEKGDIAICVKDDPFDFQLKQNLLACPPVRLNCEYIVVKKHECPNCNSVVLDIGLASNFYTERMNKKDVGYKHQLCRCGEVIPCKEVHWLNESRFKKKAVKKKSDIPFLEDESN